MDIDTFERVWDLYSGYHRVFLTENSYFIAKTWNSDYEDGSIINFFIGDAYVAKVELKDIVYITTDMGKMLE